MPAGSALAGGLDFDEAGARAVGRAGAVMVSEDGGAALLINPAGLARRLGWRIQLGVSLHDNDSSFAAAEKVDHPDNIGDPLVESRAGPVTAPQIAVLGALGSVVVGAAYLHTGGASRELQTQPFSGVPRIPHDYGGTDMSYRRRTFLAGVAIRPLPWLGIGLSLNISQARLEESRLVWAGIGSPSDMNDQLAFDPEFDLILTTAGRDNFVAGASAGLLIAPLELPLEVAISASVAQNAELSGDAELDRSRNEVFPQPEVVDPLSQLELASPLVVRAGIRYLGERFSLEAGGDFAMFFTERPTWQLRGVAVRDAGQTVGTLTEVPALIDYRDHGALRIAGDIEVASGFLWLSAGYAYRMAASRQSRYSPGYADLGGHTIAVGAESQWNGITMTIGYNRTVTAEVEAEASDVSVVNPFDSGTAGAGRGTYGAARDAFGLSLEIAWE